MISILHKAKRADSLGWAYGTPRFDGLIVEIVSDTTAKKYIINKDTACRYIGVLDRDNRKIFEGDIVQLSQRGLKKGIIEWDTENLGWVINFNLPENGNKTLTHYKPSVRASKAHLYKVVGNIFDDV